MLFLFGCSDYEVNPKGAVVEPGENCPDAAPEPSTVVVDEGCVRAPTVGSFTPVIEWQWNVNDLFPGYDDIMSTPAVANLDDDDGDHVIGEDDIPDVVFSTFSAGAYTSAGVLVAVSGDGTRTLWATAGPADDPVYSSASPAIGDIDADGRPDVCTTGTVHAVVCFNNDGSFKWSAGTELAGYGGPVLGDMDADGLAEVALGREIFDSTGNLLGQGTGGVGQSGLSAMVDWDDDGELELVSGTTVYERDGSVAWEAGIADGVPAVGDFDLDGRPDLVSVTGGVVTLVDHDGVVLWQTAIPGGGNGGPPTVADFDGDGFAEVGVAALSEYSVFDTDGTVLWSNAVSDYSSSVTGSSVFDFEADGAAEVVYADEHDLWVFDGATGAVKLDETGHASGTLYEYPLVVDVDGDGHTEIVVASNNYAFEGWNGITVIGDADDSWAASRPVWNEFAYHITNVENDGTLPRVEEPNWERWNNFRAGGTDLGPAHWLPDLGVEVLGVCTGDCLDDNAEFWVSVHNSGLLDARDVAVVATNGPGDDVWSTVVPEVRSGAAEVVGPVVLPKTAWRGHVKVRVDPDDEIDQCDDADDVVDAGAWPCGG